MRSGGPVLELGVGTGRVAVPIAAAGVEVVGVDLSAGMLEVAREQAELVGVELDLRHGDMRDPPVDESETFPLVICPFRSLLHMETDDDRRLALFGPRPGDCPRSAAASSSTSSPRPGGHRRHARPLLEREPGIWERADWDEATRTLLLRLRGMEAESEMSLSWLGPRVAAAPREEGFAVDALYGWFDRSPWRGGEDSVWVCRKAG